MACFLRWRAGEGGDRSGRWTGVIPSLAKTAHTPPIRVIDAYKDLGYTVPEAFYELDRPTRKALKP